MTQQHTVIEQTHLSNYLATSFHQIKRHGVSSKNQCGDYFDYHSMLKNDVEALIFQNRLLHHSSAATTEGVESEKGGNILGTT